MTVPQADGITEVTRHGPSLQNILQTTALRGPAPVAHKRRRKPNTRRRPKKGNAAKRIPRADDRSPTCQSGRGQCLLEESPEDPILLLVLL